MPKVVEIDKNGSSNLDKYVKLSVIALAFAGIYFLITAKSKSSQQNSTDEIAVKQQCQQVGDAYWQKLQDYFGLCSGQNCTQEFINNGYSYSKTLHTCVISWEEKCSPPSCPIRIHQYFLDDTFKIPKYGQLIVFEEVLDNPSQNAGNNSIDFNSKIQNLGDFEAKRQSIMGN